MSHSIGESMPVDACRLLSRMSSSFLASALFASAALACPVIAPGPLFAQESPAGNADGASSQDGAAPAQDGAAPAQDGAAPQEGAPENAQPEPPANDPPQPAAPGVDVVGELLKQQAWTREVMAIKKPLLPEDAETTFNQKVSREFRSLMSNGGNLSNAQELDILKKGLEFKIFRITQPDAKQASILNEIRRDLNGAGSLIANTQNKQRFREAVCREALAILKQLMDNNLEARSFAIAVMTDLEVVSASFQQKRIEVYSEVPTTLAAILNDDKQPDSVKLRAADAIGVLLRKTDVVPLVQLQLAKSLIQELNRVATEQAFQQRLLQTLMLINQPRELVGTPAPSVLQAFVDVLSDSRRDLRVRCLAARGVGKVPFDSQINFEPIAWKVTQLARDTAVWFNSNPKNPAWQACGWNLYLAFHHEVAPPGNQGMLNRAPQSKVVIDGYAQALKVVVPMIGSSKAIPEADLQAMSEWINANKPASLKYDANATEIQP